MKQSHRNWISALSTAAAVFLCFFSARVTEAYQGFCLWVHNCDHLYPDSGFQAIATCFVATWLVFVIPSIWFDDSGGIEETFGSKTVCAILSLPMMAFVPVFWPFPFLLSLVGLGFLEFLFRYDSARFLMMMH